MNLKEFIKSRKRIMTEELVFHYFSQLVRIIKNYDMFYINVNILPEHIYFKEEFDTIHLKLPHFIRSHTTNELFTIQSIGRILDFMSSTIHKSNMLKQLIANMNQFTLKQVESSEWYTNFYYHYTSFYPIIPVTIYRKFIVNGISEESMKQRYKENQQFDYIGIFKEDLMKDVSVLPIYHLLTDRPITSKHIKYMYDDLEEKPSFLDFVSSIKLKIEI